MRDPRKFYYLGQSRNVATFGQLSKGDEVVLQWDNTAADDLARDTANWFERPNTGVEELDEYVLFAPASGVNLPPNPADKQIVVVIDASGIASSVPVQIRRNGKTIDRLAVDSLITVTGGKKRFFYDGAGWRSF